MINNSGSYEFFDRDSAFDLIYEATLHHGIFGSDGNACGEFSDTASRVILEEFTGKSVSYGLAAQVIQSSLREHAVRSKINRIKEASPKIAGKVLAEDVVRKMSSHRKVLHSVEDLGTRGYTFQVPVPHKHGIQSTTLLEGVTQVMGGASGYFYDIEPINGLVSAFDLDGSDGSHWIMEMVCRGMPPYRGYDVVLTNPRGQTFTVGGGVLPGPGYPRLSDIDLSEAAGKSQPTDQDYSRHELNEVEDRKQSPRKGQHASYLMPAGHRENIQVSKKLLTHYEPMKKPHKNKSLVADDINHEEKEWMSNTEGFVTTPVMHSYQMHRRKKVSAQKRPRVADLTQNPEGVGYQMADYLSKYGSGQIHEYGDDGRNIDYGMPQSPPGVAISDLGYQIPAVLRDRYEKTANNMVSSMEKRSKREFTPRERENYKSQIIQRMIMARRQRYEDIEEAKCKTPGEKIRSKGKGRGEAFGKGEGPIGVPSGADFVVSGDEITCKTPGKNIRSKGEGRGEAFGKGRGPRGIPVKVKLKRLLKRKKKELAGQEES